jgi:hypothetical protein
MRREESDVLALSVLAAAFVASDHTDPLARAVEMHERIRREVDAGGAPDEGLADRGFELHGSLVAAALSAGHDATRAIALADDALARIYEKENGR